MNNPETAKLTQETIDTYNQSAEALAEYFRGIGPRTDDVERAISLSGNPESPRVVEIGCGDGRDAQEIIERAGWYLGFDISHSMIDLAEKHVPNALFEVADLRTFEFPPDLDVVFAFASLLHTSREELGDVFERVYKALNPQGIFYISLKYADTYHKEIQEDQFGKRLFYYYHPEAIQSLTNIAFKSVFEQKSVKGSTEWFEMALQKPARRILL